MGASSARTSGRRWSETPERGSLWGMRFTAWSYRVAPRVATLALVHAVVTYFWATDRAGRRASAAYLRRVWATPEGRCALGAAPGPWQSFLHYREFALAIFDRIAIWLDRAPRFEFRTAGMEIFDRLAEEHRGAIVLGAHLGSFDALRLLAREVGRRVNVLMFTAHAQRINTMFRELSPDAEARVIAVEEGALRAVFQIRACLERGEHVAILGDRVEPGDRGRTSRVELLGGPVELPQAPFLLAELLGCPVVLMIALRQGPGRYEVFAEPLVDRLCLPRPGRGAAVTGLLAAYAKRLEHYCLRAPYQWFNFFDFWGDASA